jgi:hypothetical protein
MPRGVKGSGPYSKAGKNAKPASPRKPSESDDDALDAPDPRTPTCRIDGAALEPGGQCASCRARAAHFQRLLQLEAELRRCDICRAPAKSSRGGKRHCAPCRALNARAVKIQPQGK